MREMSPATVKELKQSKVSVVNTIPGTDEVTGNPYDAFWTKVTKTPVGKYLRIANTPRNQKLISHALYYRAKQSRKNIIVAMRDNAMFVGLK